MPYRLRRRWADADQRIDKLSRFGRSALPPRRPRPRCTIITAVDHTFYALRWGQRLDDGHALPPRHACLLY